MTDNHGLDVLMREANPFPTVPTTVAFDDLPARIRNVARVRRRRRVRLGVAGIGVVGLLGVGGPALAGYFTAATGIPVPACPHLPGVCENGTGTIVRFDAPDIGTLYPPYFPKYPLPAGQTWTAFERRVSVPSKVASEGPNGLIEEFVASSAECQWFHSWLAAKSDGDTAVQARAQQEIVSVIPHWSVLTGHIDEPTSDEDQAAASVTTGDGSYVAQFVKANCLPSDWATK